MQASFQSIDSYGVFSRYTRLSRKTRRHGGEFAGMCPFCQQGTDRFLCWPYRERPGYLCRVCNATGDIIQFLMELENLSFKAACDELNIDLDEWDNGKFSHISYKPKSPTIPPERWQHRAIEFAKQCKATLWQPEYSKAMEYLTQQRCLTSDTINFFGLGYNLEPDHMEPGSQWGLDEPVFIPQGFVIPWQFEGNLWRLKFRRPKGARSKYHDLEGSFEGLYLADGLNKAGAEVLIVESEFDALIVAQTSSHLIIPVATGGTDGGQTPEYISKLSRCNLVLIGFDNDADNQGDLGASYWLESLPACYRYAPWSHDITDMALQGKDIRQWVESGLRFARREEKRSTMPVAAPAVSISNDTPIETNRSLSLSGEQIEAFCDDTPAVCCVCEKPVDFYIESEDGTRLIGYCENHKHLPTLRPCSYCGGTKEWTWTTPGRTPVCICYKEPWRRPPKPEPVVTVPEKKQRTWDDFTTTLQF